MLTSATIESASDAGLTLDRTGAGGQAQLAYKSQGVLKTQLPSNYGDGKFYLYHGGANALVAESDGDITINTKLGVGGANSNGTLDVTGDTVVRGNIYFDGISSSYIDNYGHELQMRGAAGVSLWTHTGSPAAWVRQLTVEDGGNVAIGATSADEKLHVVGNVILRGANDVRLKIANNDNNNWAEIGNEGSSTKNTLDFYTASSSTPCLSLGEDDTQDHKGNRIVNSQTVNDSWRTSEPSLRFDGSNDVVTIGSTTNYGSKATVAVWVKFNKLDATDNGREGIVGSKYWSNNDFSLHLHDDGRIWFTSASAVYSNWNTTDLTIGTWVHLCLVWDTTQGTTANKAKLYINGAIQTQHSAGNHAGDLKTDTGLKIGKTEDTHDGEIKDVRLHNRAMEADEGKGLYNGESTPWKYADAGTELISNGDFSDTSSWTLHQGTNATTSFGSGVLTISNSSSSTAFTGADQSITVVKDKIYRLKLDVTVNNGAIYVRDIQNTILLYTNEAMDSGGSETPTISSTVTGQIYYFKAVASGTFTLRISRSTANGNTISVNVDNVSIQQIGEVAAYTPKSINDKWYYETSNANHGTITGAATVGNTKHLGPLHIKGKTTAGIILENTTNAQNANIDYYNNVGSVQSRIAYAEGTGAFTFVPNVSGLASGTLRLEHGNASGGAVTATSATSTTLRQVARTATDTIDGDGTAVAFEVNHQLGTKFVTVSVREKLNGGGQSFAYVDTEIRGGAWADPNGAVHTMQANSEESHITVIFATAPASGKDYYVTCVGA